MLLIGLSLLVGLVGALASRVGPGYVAARAVDRDPHVYWALGLLAPVPAWLIVFWFLLGPSPRPRQEIVSAGSWVLSTAVGLIGAILTEGVGHKPPSAGLGVLAFSALRRPGASSSWGTP